MPAHDILVAFGLGVGDYQQKTPDVQTATWATPAPSTVDAFFADNGIYAAPAAPALSQGESYLDPVFGHRVFRLSPDSINANVAYSYWATLNCDNSIMLWDKRSVGARLSDLSWGTDTVTVTNERAAFQDGVNIFWEGFTWDPGDPDVGYGHGTLELKVYSHDVSTQTTTLIKNFALDSTFTSAFPTATNVFQLIADRNAVWFQLTARNGSTPLGCILWKRTTDDLCTFVSAGGENYDEGQPDLDGSHGIMQYDYNHEAISSSGCGRSGALTGTESPSHLAAGDNRSFHIGPNELREWLLTSPYTETVRYTAPKKNSKLVLAGSHSSTLPNDDWVYGSSYFVGPIQSTWVNYSGYVWRINWASEIVLQTRLDSPPEMCVRNRAEPNPPKVLEEQTAVPTAANQWYYDETYVYVWLDDDSNPNSSDMFVWDWRLFLHEIWAVKADGSSIRRFCHTHNLDDTYRRLPRANISYDGSYGCFNSNWYGHDQTAVYAVRLDERESRYIDDIDWTPGSLITDAAGTDLWPTTWADDDKQYTAGGDGWGFTLGGTKSGRIIASLSGAATSYIATDLYEAEDGGGPPFITSIGSINGVLYINQNEDDVPTMGLHKSTDHGVSIGSQIHSWSSGGWQPRYIIQHGQDNALADGYVYWTFTDSSGDATSLHIVRVPEANIESKNSYQVFTGTPSNPSWSTWPSFGSGVEVIPAYCSITYCPAIKRYLAISGWESDLGAMKFYESSNVYGPYRLVENTSTWCGFDSESVAARARHIAPRWVGSVSGTDLDFWVVFSADGSWDRFNAVKGTLTLI